MKGFSVIEMWESMSIIVKCITTFMLLLSIWTMFAMIERFVVFRRASVQNYMYVLQLRDHLAKRKVDDALKAARVHVSSPVAKVVESGLVAYKQGLSLIHISE